MHASGLDENAQVGAAVAQGPSSRSCSFIPAFIYGRGPEAVTDKQSLPAQREGISPCLMVRVGLGGGGGGPSGLARVTRSPLGLWALHGVSVLPSRGKHVFYKR